ncbi:hypothetical protein HN51_004387 [Arachis hypogaea]
MLVRWVTPSEGAIKLNVDGSSRENPRRAECGSLLRDQDGNCIVGFFGYRKVENESDCMVPLEIINDNTEDFPKFANILEEIDQFMLLEWDVTIYHVMREANLCANVFDKDWFFFEFCIFSYE